MRLLEKGTELCPLYSHVPLLLQNNYCSDSKSRLIKTLQMSTFYTVGYCRERQDVEQTLMSLSGYYLLHHISSTVLRLMRAYSLNTATVVFVTFQKKS